ncbi:hypothetical protein SELMODRAFT_413291 [Selaginella moellendorffii]|uniref:Uncharacterized protein n=1 Tax=Selaginella moellendorffii TaxID=88036 RepID=D8RNZ6_SELML|nr:hypothetical protein SELMODRAFT_413291 [Selaginella moellendorffii]
MVFIETQKREAGDLIEAIRHGLESCVLNLYPTFVQAKQRDTQSLLFSKEFCLRDLRSQAEQAARGAMPNIGELEGDIIVSYKRIHPLRKLKRRNWNGRLKNSEPNMPMPKPGKSFPYLGLDSFEDSARHDAEALENSVSELRALQDKAVEVSQKSLLILNTSFQLLFLNGNLLEMTLTSFLRSSRRARMISKGVGLSTLSKAKKVLALRDCFQDEVFEAVIASVRITANSFIHAEGLLRYIHSTGYRKERTERRDTIASGLSEWVRASSSKCQCPVVGSGANLLMRTCTAKWGSLVEVATTNVFLLDDLANYVCRLYRLEVDARSFCIGHST